MVNINDSIVKRAATDSLAHVAMQAPQQTTQASSIYDSGYREHYATAVSSSANPPLTPQSSTYSGVPGSNTHPYNLGHQITVPQVSDGTFEQHPYSAPDESAVAAGHVGALTAITTNNTSLF
jgi:hypothetical protein